MTLLYDLSLLAAGFGFGVFFVGAVGMPWARRRGRAYTAEEVRVLELPTLIRDHHPKAIEAWPVTPRDFDGLEDLPRQYGTLPEHKRRLELTATPHTVESWPLLWRVLWPVLLFVARFWWTPVGVGVDRAVVTLWTFLGRHERRFWAEVEPAPNTAAAILARLAHERAILAALDWKVDEPQMVEVGT